MDPGQRIRLLKFLTLFGVGGTEKQVVNLAGRLDRERFHLTFACLRRWGELISDLERRQIDIAEYPIHSFKELNTLRQEFKLIAELRRKRIQIVHSYNFYANLFSIPAARAAGVPCIVASVRDMGAYMTPMQVRAQRWVCRLADRVVVNAEAIRTWLTDQGFPQEKIAVIRNGLDLDGRPVPRDSSAVRGGLKIPPDAKIVLMLSRLNPQKGVDYFLQAAARVAWMCPEAYFVVVGEAYVTTRESMKPDNGYQKRLVETAARLGLGDRIRFTGMRNDVPELLAQASVSVLPSLSEGLSNTLLESMAGRVPVVATRVGGTPEVIEHGREGLLVPPRDAPALAEAIGAILTDPLLAGALRDQARRRVERQFSFDRMVRENEDLYIELLEQRWRKGGRRQRSWARDVH